MKKKKGPTIWNNEFQNSGHQASKKCDPWELRRNEVNMVDESSPVCHPQRAPRPHAGPGHWGEPACCPIWGDRLGIREASIFRADYKREESCLGRICSSAESTLLALGWVLNSSWVWGNDRIHGKSHQTAPQATMPRAHTGRETLPLPTGVRTVIHRVSGRGLRRVLPQK